uniref:Uncharacterized protein n=1 Tax=Anguilla anguilla TaxID=7936 RepID=A0A0E9QGP1_ANGAN
MEGFKKKNHECIKLNKFMFWYNMLYIVRFESLMERLLLLTVLP